MIIRVWSGFAALVGTPTITSLGKDDPNWDISVSADTTMAALKFEVNVERNWDGKMNVLEYRLVPGMMDE